ncbi:MAG: ABC transporter permease, partial [Steroidobacteraceae bacterium]
MFKYSAVFHPLSLFVGLRYVRARTHKFFVSFITWVSLIGVCVGVAALVVILSVMNGFEGELRDRLLSLSSDARVVAAQGAPTPSTAQWDGAIRAVRSVPGVAGVAPYIEAQVLAVRTPEMYPVTLRGIDPHDEGSVTKIARFLTAGHLAELTPASNRAVVGDVVAQQLGLTIGDTVRLLIVSTLP